MSSPLKMVQREFSVSQLISSLLESAAKEYCEKDKIYFRNFLLGEMHESEYDFKPTPDLPVWLVLSQLSVIAISRGIISVLESESFQDKICALLMPSPSQFEKTFSEIYHKDAEQAFDYFHNFCEKTYYIKSDRIAKNQSWSYASEYGNFTLTINLSKPEKSPEEIALLAKANKNSTVKYPLCPLCKENIGFFGDIKRSSRQNLRTIDLTLAGTKFFMHFSPYAYFPHHHVVNLSEHKNMLISEDTVKQMLEYVSERPFYFLASNSDIPIVGGSILNHLHFQGGKTTFPIENAQVFADFKVGGVDIELLNWPIPTVRLVSNSQEEINYIFKTLRYEWYKYNQSSMNIHAQAEDGSRQNAISLLARNKANKFLVYITFRNNAISEKYPLGVYHFHSEIWNIKKENIGIIEQVGMAILPERLVKEFAIMEKCFAMKEDLPEEIAYHKDFYKELVANYDYQKNFTDNIRNLTGKHFVKGLEQCSVFNTNLNQFEIFIRKALGQ